MTPAWTSQSSRSPGVTSVSTRRRQRSRRVFDEVERGAAAEPVPPRLAGREREVEVLGEVVDRSLGRA